MDESQWDFCLLGMATATVLVFIGLLVGFIAFVENKERAELKKWEASYFEVRGEIQKIKREIKEEKLGFLQTTTTVETLHVVIDGEYYALSDKLADGLSIGQYVELSGHDGIIDRVTITLRGDQGTIR